MQPFLGIEAVFDLPQWVPIGGRAQPMASRGNDGL
jgi:hypothetical protein